MFIVHVYFKFCSGSFTTCTCLYMYLLMYTCTQYIHVHVCTCTCTNCTCTRAGTKVAKRHSKLRHKKKQANI